MAPALSKAPTAQAAQGTYRSTPKLWIDGQEAPNTLMEDILQIIVEESLHLPGMFTLVIRNDYFPAYPEEQPWRHQALLQIGKTVKIVFESSTTDSQEFQQQIKGQVIEAEITAIEAHFSEQSQAPVIVRGYDTCHRLHRGQYNRSFQNMTDTDVVKKIATEVGIPLGQVENSGAPHEYLFQKNQTNMQFLRGRAARIGFELFNQDGQLHFRKPKANQELSLKWLKDVNSFSVRVTSAEQIKAVEVRAWDYEKKAAIVSTAQTAQLITQTDNGKGSDTSTKFSGKPPTPKRIVVDQPVSSPKEADAIAQAICNEVGGQFIYADAKAEGNPQIRPGRVIKLTEMGSHSGKYYVTETRHLYQQSNYTTEFSIRGLRGGDVLTTLAPPTTLQPGQTFLVGIVTDNNDPKGWGRVKVKFPTLTEDHTSHWARVVSLGAANQRGFDCLPEINDEVLIAFEHGDIHRPYVLGGVWNGKDAPPAAVKDSVQNGKVRLRTLKTRTGHQLQFVEEDKGMSQAGVYIETKGGHQIRLNDSQQLIEIETKGGHKVSLNDRTGNVSFSSTVSMNLDATSTISTKAGAAVSTKAATVDTTAAASLSMKSGGATSVAAGAAISMTAGAAVNLTAAGVITLTGSAITLTAGSVTIITPTKIIPF